MENLPAPRDPDPMAEISALAQLYRRANGPVMALVNRLGGSVEKQLAVIPEATRRQIEAQVTRALEASLGLARQADRLPDPGPRGRMAAAMASGALGGAGGLATALAELPVSITMILAAIRAEAREAGFDPDDPAIRAECIRVFGAGSPLAADDGINTTFLSARLTLTGPAVHRMLAAVAPRLAAAMGQKLAAQAVPVIGAATGAALNAAFLGYYRDMARIRFGLMRLSVLHGAERILADFRDLAEPPKLRKF